MATAPNPGLPLLYRELVPISSVDHADWKMRQVDEAPYLAQEHAIPILVDEFVDIQRFYPIVFSAGGDPVPLALMGLNAGINTVIDAQGKMLREAYIPAYIRRYPFMLARLRPDSEEMSLCVDPTFGQVGPGEEGQPLFTDGQPSDATKGVMDFCEKFEQSAQQTGLFVRELQDAKMLIDGEITIEQQGNEKPFIYRGFQMVDQEKFRELRGDQLRKWAQNGVLPLVFCHLFSLQLMSQLFDLQVQMGKLPEMVDMGAGQ